VGFGFLVQQNPPQKLRAARFSAANFWLSGASLHQSSPPLTTPTRRKSYIRRQGAPIVVKADGLAAGKGSIVCATLDEALRAVDRIMVEREFGDAGKRIVVEEFLTGREASVMVFTDGRTVKPMLPSRDHKRLLDNDQGPNTGGMGAYCPVPDIDASLYDEIVETIMKPTIAALAGGRASLQGCALRWLDADKRRSESAGVQLSFR
jgi:phosphoribosylamine-glycine ligase